MDEQYMIGNEIGTIEDRGYYLNVFDLRPETLAFMEERGLQGGGPTWMALITAALELESPATIQALDFDDEGEGVQVQSESREALETAQSYVSRLMADPDFREQCIQKAEQGGYIE